MRSLQIPTRHQPEQPDAARDAGQFLFHIPALPVPVEQASEIERASGLRGIGIAWFATAAVVSA